MYFVGELSLPVRAGVRHSSALGQTHTSCLHLPKARLNTEDDLSKLKAPQQPSRGTVDFPLTAHGRHNIRLIRLFHGKGC